MASGSTAMLRRATQDCLCQASAEHFQQCAEFPLLCNRGLGPLAVMVLPIALAGIADISGQPLSPRSRRRPALMASYPHPLQVRAGRNQLQPLLVTMPHGELLHAWRWNSTSGAAPHAVRAWGCALLHFQVRELLDEASIFAVLRLKPLNLFLTLLPVHSFSLGDWFNPGVHT